MISNFLLSPKYITIPNEDNLLEPKIYAPIPIKIYDEIKSIASEDDRKHLLKCLFFFCKMYVINYHQIPYFQYIPISRKKIEKCLSQNITRRMWSNVFVPNYLNRTNYIPGKKAYSYRFKTHYLTGSFNLYELNKIKINQFESLEENPESQPSKNQECLLTTHYQSTLLNANIKLCNLYNPVLVSEILESSIIKTNSQIDITEYCGIPQFSWKAKQSSIKQNYDPVLIQPDQKESFYDLCVRLRFEQRKYRLNNYNNYISVSRDSTTRRLHSNLTYLPSECVNHIKLDNESLVEIDMKNCHYTLFSNIISGYNQNWNNLIISSTLDQYNRDKSLFHNDSRCWSITKEKYVVNTATTNFIRWSKEGVLYENLEGVFSGDDDASSWSREDIKVMLMSVFYGNPYSRSRHARCFSKEFTQIYNTVCDIKWFVYNNWESLNYENDPFLEGVLFNKKNKSAFECGKSSVAILLMRMESQLFVDQLYQELISHEIDCFTKHDSILVKSSELEKAHSIIKSLLDEELGEGNYSLRL